MNIHLFLSKDLNQNSIKWLRHYYVLCKRGYLRGHNKSKVKFYCEAHHITPKCMGGSNEKSNLTLLTAEEHFVAHQLLVKIFPYNIKLKQALSMMMCSSKNRQRINNKSYAWLRKEVSKGMMGTIEDGNERAIKISKALSGRTKENDESKRKASEKLVGRNKFNDEGYAKASAAVSKTISGRTSEEYPYLIEAAKKRSITLSGRNKHTHSYIAQVAEKTRGENHCFACVWILQNPDGEQIEVRDLVSFCKNYNLPYSTITARGLNHNTKPIRGGAAKDWIVVLRIPKF